MISLLQKTLEAGEFAITAEMAPPKGTDFSHILSLADALVGRCHGVNVTDFQSAAVKATSMALCIELQKKGLEAIIQMTGRDRNRIAIQGEMLSAAHFGIKNMLAITGDHTTVGDNAEAKPVFEFDSIGILQAATILMGGTDMGGNALEGTPEFYLGACVTPVFDPVEVQIIKMRNKIKTGAKFFQTQGVYEIEVMREFKKMTEDLGGYVLAGIIPLKSAGMAKFMNNNVPGISVPDVLIERMKTAENKVAEGNLIAGEFCRQLKEEGICDGVHIMAIGAEENVPKILDIAGL